MLSQLKYISDIGEIDLVDPENCKTVNWRDFMAIKRTPRVGPTARAFWSAAVFVLESECTSDHLRFICRPAC